MARTSRKKFMTDTVPIHNPVKYKVGAYIRISKEDDERDSSIVNQEAIIREYIDGNPEMKIYKTYVDNGVSSFSAIRKAFEEMIADIDIGNVNCIVVKDLSRFGRDYIETGYYIETVFPSKGVRFIALHDNYDSHSLINTNETIYLAFKNVMNTHYSKEISKKVKSIIVSKMEQGCYVPAYLPYGYKKQRENDICKFAIDRNVSNIVERIFESACNGMTSFEIAGMLNNENISSPSKYKGKAPFTQWSKYTIDRILNNRTYIGKMICRRTSNMLINRSVKKLAESDWIIIENHHEPIISVDIFNQAQRNDRSGITLKSPKPQITLEYYQKDLYCGDCGRKMRKRVWKGRTYFICPRYEEAKNLCSIKSIRDDILKANILACIKEHNPDRITNQTDLSYEMYACFVDKVYVYDNLVIRLQYKNDAKDEDYEQQYL